MTETVLDLRNSFDAAAWTRLGARHLPGLLGIEILDLAPVRLRSRLAIRPELLAPNGYLHAATVTALADTSCGYATVVNLPESATGFTTIELKCNFLGTARDGALLCIATPRHRGATTQVWDAEVARESDGTLIATFRCTQMVLRELPR